MGRRGEWWGAGWGAVGSRVGSGTDETGPWSEGVAKVGTRAARGSGRGPAVGAAPRPRCEPLCRATAGMASRAKRKIWTRRHRSFTAPSLTREVVQEALVGVHHHHLPHRPLDRHVVPLADGARQLNHPLRARCGEPWCGSNRVRGRLAQHSAATAGRQAAPSMPHRRQQFSCCSTSRSQAPTCMRSTLVCTRSSPACRRGVGGWGAGGGVRTQRAQHSMPQRPRACPVAATAPARRRMACVARRHGGRPAQSVHPPHLCCLGHRDVAEVDRLGGVRRQRAPQVAVHRLCGDQCRGWECNHNESMHTNRMGGCGTSPLRSGAWECNHCHEGQHGAPVKKGVKGAMTLHTVSSTSNSAASAMAVSSGPLRPCKGAWAGGEGQGGGLFVPVRAGWRAHGMQRGGPLLVAERPGASQQGAYRSSAKAATQPAAALRGFPSGACGCSHTPMPRCHGHPTQPLETAKKIKSLP